MKPIVFYGTINLESDILYVQSNKDYYSVDDTFTLKINDSSFGIKNIKEDKKWFKFDKSKRHDGEIYLSIENDKKEIFNKDNIEVANGYVCPASKQDNKCDSCRACWSDKVSEVSYVSH